MMWWEGLFTDYNDMGGGGYTRSTMMWWEGLYTEYNDVVGGAIYRLQ